MKHFMKATALALLLMVTTIYAAASSPVTMLEGVSDRMISKLEQHKSELKKDGVIQKIVDTVLIPHIALSYMGMSVVGRYNWQKATAAQRQEFVRQFTRLVTSTYSAALASYDDDKVKFYPIRGDWQSKRILQVRSVIMRRSGQRIPVVYNVVRSKHGWLVYDFSIENVSITRSYRAQFASVLSQSGMEGLLKRLASHNAK